MDENSRDIDRQIEELMGHKSTHWTIGFWHIETEEGRLYMLPNYSTDWNDMSLLVEWLNGKGLRVEIDVQPDRIYCQIFKVVDDQWWSLSVIRLDSSDAPLALCKAVLSLPAEVLI